MDASRLLSLLNVLERDISSGYEERLNGLFTTYVQVRDNPGQDLSTPVKAARASLEEWVKASPTNDFVPSRRWMMEAIGAQSLFGLPALAAINEVLNNPG